MPVFAALELVLRLELVLLHHYGLREPGFAARPARANSVDCVLHNLFPAPVTGTAMAFE